MLFAIGDHEATAGPEPDTILYIFGSQMTYTQYMSGFRFQ